MNSQLPTCNLSQGIQGSNTLQGALAVINMSIYMWSHVELPLHEDTSFKYCPKEKEHLDFFEFLCIRPACLIQFADREHFDTPLMRRIDPHHPMLLMVPYTKCLLNLSFWYLN